MLTADQDRGRLYRCRAVLRLRFTVGRPSWRRALRWVNMCLGSAAGAADVRARKREPADPS